MKKDQLMHDEEEFNGLLDDDVQIWTLSIDA
jgi:hypothetical protein